LSQPPSGQFEKARDLEDRQGVDKDQVGQARDELGLPSLHFPQIGPSCQKKFAVAIVAMALKISQPKWKTICKVSLAALMPLFIHPCLEFFTE
jgi:hypothetical protein